MRKAEARINNGLASKKLKTEIFNVLARATLRGRTRAR
jgi:hypothetical protein